MLSVGNCRLKMLLLEKKITQTELAAKLSMKKQRINEYCHDRQMMSLTNAYKIARALDVQVEDLYELNQSNEQ